MSHEVAPAVAKVGASENQAEAPAMDASKNNIAISPPAPPGKAGTEAAGDASKLSEPVTASESKTTVAPASAAAHIIPKPVQMQSAPETPVSANSPANGPPRQELDISPETDEPGKPKQEAEVPTGIIEPLPTPSISNAPTNDEFIVDKPAPTNPTNGAAHSLEMTGALQTEQPGKDPKLAESGAGEKRKPDDDANEPIKDAQASNDAQRSDKKVRIDDTAESKTNGAHVKGRPGRPRKENSKKEKKAPPMMGKTARKTRSQGPAEGV